jgi:hypothetical protein
MSKSIPLNAGGDGMTESVPIYCDDKQIGRTLTRDEFIEMDPGELYDQLMDCNWALVFVWTKGGESEGGIAGTLGIEDLGNIDTRIPKAGGSDFLSERRGQESC